MVASKSKEDRWLYGENFNFRSKVQSPAVITLLENSVKELVVIMPTGGGRSILLLVESPLCLATVIIPLCALIKDIGSRLSKVGIDFME